MRVLEQPQMLINPQGKKELYFVTDTGCYWLRDLGKAIGVSSEAMRGRWAKMHWSNPGFLAANKTHGKTRKQKSVCARLGIRAREHNLQKIAGPGLLEGRL